MGTLGCSGEFLLAHDARNIVIDVYGKGDLPADNVPINGLIVFSSSVGKHTLSE